LPSGAPVLLPLLVHRESGATGVDTTTLIINEADETPREFKKSRTMRVLGQLNVNIADIPKHHWKKRRTSSGFAYQDLDVEIGMKVESGGLCFDYRVGGVVYGEVKLDFE